MSCDDRWVEARRAAVCVCVSPLHHICIQMCLEPKGPCESQQRRSCSIIIRQDSASLRGPAMFERCVCLGTAVVGSGLSGG